MSVAFFRGQQLGREDLNLFLENASSVPVNAAEIAYALYDFTTAQEVLVGVPRRIPANPSVGEYYASIVVPLDANLGNYRIRWTFRESIAAPMRQVVQEFEVVDKVTSGTFYPAAFTQNEASLIRSLRILLRDNAPDRHYHFRPPAHEETIRQFNRVFGFIWEDEELKEFLDRGLDMVMAYPPRTPFSSLDALVQRYPDWKTLVITAGKMLALDALRINWIADEFNYSIGGISLDIDKASKYESAMQASAEQFDKQIEKAKATVNIIRGVQQSRFGTGVRSAFGPYLSAGTLTPAKFLGF